MKGERIISCIKYEGTDWVPLDDYKIKCREVDKAFVVGQLKMKERIVTHLRTKCGCTTYLNPNLGFASEIEKFEPIQLVETE